MKILLTGAAGFIAHHVAERLLDQGLELVGVDNFTPYYDLTLKEARLARLEGRQGFRFVRMDLSDRAATAALFEQERFDRVIHLAAQPGVRYSLEHPFDYVDANLTAHLAILEGCRNTGVGHLIYASSSSVYGMNRETPFSTAQRTDHPISLYAATKKANEMMAHSYAHLFRIPTTGLRFFTVYGPWGRPDMATFSFTRAILEGRSIDVYGEGAMKRDFTYVGDIADSVVALLERQPEPDPTWTVETGDPAASSAPHRIYNIGNGEPVLLMDFIHTLERLLGKEAKLVMKPIQPGDVLETSSDTSPLTALLGHRPYTPLAVGLGHFVRWYRDFYSL
ncbi:NAD-dependent epimerase [Holophaga foetida]|uniref:NAD-dependent epimerase n=1 Tax=Holophaga foetida TaxID=35839 RepID=UPI0002474698|nr:NAD-dependent epimerase [Holophaga foetida]